MTGPTTSRRHPLQDHPPPDGPVTRGTATREPVAELASITKRFGATLALDSVDLTVEHARTHGLVGRNGAGKSTIVGILTGLHRPDSGELLLRGRPVPLHHPERWKQHVACVYQQPMLLPNLSVAENLLIGRLPRRRGRIDWRRTYLEAARILEQWDLRVAPRAWAGELDVEQAQLVEIAKALSLGCELIVLDEPTARLDSAAATRLFTSIRRLQEAGATFLFISHYLHEVFDVCDEVSVLRDGRRIHTHRIGDVRADQLVEEMVGDTPPPPATATHDASPGPAWLVITGLTGARFHPLNLTAAPGEIVGIAGLASSGRSQIGEAIAGMEPAEGRLVLDGTPVPLGRVDRALARGIALIPRDRHRAGLVADLPVSDNLTLAQTHRHPGRFGIVSMRRRRELADNLIHQLDVSPPRPEAPTSGLSGGNQQKVVFGRALATQPKVLVAVEPTAGVDVASKARLLHTLTHAASRGISVIICSDDLDDLRVCHRVIVIRDGHRAAELDSGWPDQHLVAEIEGTLHVAP